MSCLPCVHVYTFTDIHFGFCSISTCPEYSANPNMNPTPTTPPPHCCIHLSQLFSMSTLTLAHQHMPCKVDPHLNPLSALSLTLMPAHRCRQGRSPSMCWLTGSAVLVDWQCDACGGGHGGVRRFGCGVLCRRMYTCGCVGVVWGCIYACMLPCTLCLRPARRQIETHTSIPQAHGCARHVLQHRSHACNTIQMKSIAQSPAQKLPQGVLRSSFF